MTEVRGWGCACTLVMVAALIYLVGVIMRPEVANMWLAWGLMVLAVITAGGSVLSARRLRYHNDNHHDRP